MMNYLEWFMENWSIVVAFICVIVAIVVAVVKFFRLPTNTQISQIKECLLAWVVEAEASLGGGTGEIKLRTVYGWFVTSFPIVKNFVPFELFSTWVDEALDSMKDMLKSNEKLKTYVEDVPMIELKDCVEVELKHD